MKRFLTSLGAAAVLAGCLVPLGTQAASPAARMSIKVLPSTGPRTVRGYQNVRVRLRTSGIVLDARWMGQRNQAGHGHIQVYRDSIPKDAYSRPDRSHNFLAALPVSSFRLGLSRSRLRSAGKHKIIVALAQNNFVLYRVPTASFTVNVK